MQLKQEVCSKVKYKKSRQNVVNIIGREPYLYFNKDARVHILYIIFVLIVLLIEKKYASVHTLLSVLF